MAIDLSSLPDFSGVYLMKDDSGEVIYVGKALSLRKRVRQYFQSSKNLTPKTKTLVRHIEDLEYIITDTEVDALVLEANLIKKYRPRYNVRLKDDKRYPYVKVTVNSRYPRIFLTRRRLMDGALYFGPYTNAGAVRKTLDIISQVFRIRRCRQPLNQKKERPCLDYHIKRCFAPCAGKISEKEYMENVQEAIKFLKGETSELVKELEERMYDLASKQEYEAAAQLRDQLEAIKVLSQQQIATSGTDDRDVIAAVQSGDTASIQIFYVRHGNMVGRADLAMSSAEGTTLPETISQFIKQYYLDSPIPTEILVQYDIPDHDLITSWLKQRSGREVHINVPQRGDKKKMLEMALKNAEMTMRMNRLKVTAASESLGSLKELQSVLSLPSVPLYIEGFDISNISGTDAVGSMVVFENGKPSNSKYRQHNIRTVKGIDDFAMMEEVVGRRYSRLKDEKMPFPDLILIDGGPGQLSAAKASLDELGIDIPVIGLAKRFEHIITTEKGPGEVIILPHSSQALKLLMHVRDEAHRFAVSSHRRRRSARLTHSILDGINGIGEAKKRALISHFSSVEKIGQATMEELCKIEGINKKLAQRILEKFQEHGPWNQNDKM
ncbi:excinuclease ABC, C subunit [Methanomethylovorans hollandica DSM 15978]|uniref:UvrABC system protein C n=2 Tax=Methanomethylovorans hollandica TaxID=101192 RepID=L0KYP7_METHD|nr:excinuclease ABC, C subunit [Methanomethylovorans hollandica DSM 15978]